MFGDTAVAVNPDDDRYKDIVDVYKRQGYTITSSANDTYRVYSNNVTSKWVVDGKINIDDNIMKWVDDSNELVDAGETGTYEDVYKRQVPLRLFHGCE